MAKAKEKIDYVKVQFNAGRMQSNEHARKGNAIWHTDTEGRYWIGNMYHRTPRQLFHESLSVIVDLLKNHPELAEDKR